MSLIALLLAPIALQATPAEPVCIRAGDVPPALVGWYGTPGKRPVIGKPFIVTARGGSSNARFEVARAGIYRIALSEGAWIDVVARGRMLVSTNHGHGPVCTGIRKIVDFSLPRGTYRLQLSKMKTPTVKVMIGRATAMRPPA